MSDIENKLKELPGIADEAFSNIKATEGLKYRIMEAAENGESKKKIAYPSVRLISALSCVLVVAVGLAVSIPRLTAGTDTEPKTSGETRMIHAEASEASEEIMTLSADIADEAMALDNVSNGGEDRLETLRLISVMAAGVPMPGEVRQSADLTGGSISVNEQGISGKMIVLSNGTYCLADEGMIVPQSLLDKQAGAVSVYTMDPVNAGNGSSNAVLAGENVYYVSGMGSTCVAARLNGEYRLFQLVSLNSRANSLEKVLCLSSVQSLSVDGIGTLNGAACDQAVQVLRTASLLGTGCNESRSRLVLTYQNGLHCILYVNGDNLSFCGTWSGAEFMDTVRDLAQ